MKKKIVIFFLFGIFLISIISASSLVSLGKFKLGQTVNISQVCSDASYINISSISKPDSTISVSNIQMTTAGSGGFYYLFTDTNTLGRYDVRGISDGCDKTFATYFEIETQYKDLELQDMILIIFVLFICIALGYGSLRLIKSKETNPDNHFLLKLKHENTLGYYLQIMKRNLYIVGYFGLYISILLFVAILNDSLYSVGLVEFSEITENAIIILGWGLIPFIIIWVIYLIFAFYYTVVNVINHEWGGIKK